MNVRHAKSLPTKRARLHHRPRAVAFLEVVELRAQPLEEVLVLQPAAILRPDTSRLERRGPGEGRGGAPFEAGPQSGGRLPGVISLSGEGGGLLLRAQAGPPMGVPASGFLPGRL